MCGAELGEEVAGVQGSVVESLEEVVVLVSRVGIQGTSSQFVGDNAILE